MTRKINYPKHRKSPRRHIVKAHKRRGRPVRSFTRGSGQTVRTLKKKVRIPSVKLTRDQIFEIAADTVEAIKEEGLTPLDMTEKELEEFIIAQLRYGRPPSPQIKGKIPKQLIEDVRDQMENYVGWE